MRFLPVLAVIGGLAAPSARADDAAAVPVLQQIFQQFVLMNSKLDALNGKIDALSNRASDANYHERVFVFTLPGAFRKGAKEDGRDLCANLGGTLKGAYSYGGNIIVSCNY